LQEKFSDDFEGADNQWLKAVQELTDVNLTIDFIPTLIYTDEVNSLLFHNKLPMVVVANENVLESVLFISNVENNDFWVLDDYIEEFPNLFQFIGEEKWENCKISGHIYGIPRLRILPRNAACYRLDWAEKLGIDPPQTLDELYDMLYAFTYDDPDGNGIADTFGLITSWSSWNHRSWNGIQTLTTALGGPNGWCYENGTMVPDFAADEYMQTLNFFRKLYADGILTDNFAVINSLQKSELFVSGKGGMTFGVIDDIFILQRQVCENDPEARLGVLPLIYSEEDKWLVNATQGYNGLIMFNKSGDGGIHTEEELKRVLQYYDTLCSGEGQELINYGLEGAHHIIDSTGKKQLLYDDIGESTFSKSVGAYLQSFPVNAYVRRAGDTLLQNEVYDEIEKRMNYLVMDDSGGLVSATYKVNSSSLNDIIRNASIRFILGEITENGYYQKYEEWLENGGAEIITEYTEAYNDKNGK